MADPRLAVSLDGVDAKYESFLADGVTITYSATSEGGSAVVGRAVNFSAAATVQLAADASAVIGKLIRVESDGVCVVQTGGYMTLPGGVGAALTLSKKIVGAASAAPANGYIREVNTAAAAELGLARGFIVDAGTTTAVVVKL